MGVTVLVFLGVHLVASYLRPKPGAPYRQVACCAVGVRHAFAAAFVAAAAVLLLLLLVVQ
jgi:hypothetical protein